MQFDQNLLIEDGAAITVTRDSTDVLDLGAANKGRGNQLFFEVDVAEAFTAAGAATLDVDLQSSADNSTWASVKKVSTIGKATLTRGYRVFQYVLTPTEKRYWKLVLTVATGPMTAGKLIAGIVPTQVTTV